MLRLFTAPTLVAFGVIAALSGARDACAQSNPDDILVIANVGVPVESLSLADMRDIYNKTRTRWDGAGSIVPVNAPRSSQLRLDFVKRLFGSSLPERGVYWEKRKVSDGAQPPIEFSLPLKACFRLKGSLCYVYRKDYQPGVVKVVLTLRGESPTPKAR